jgi:hypothetical protein
MHRLSLLLPLALLSCSSKDEAPPTTADSGPITIESFAPKGCAYTVRHPQVEGFPSFEPHADVVESDPQLRHVFRGLGGDVKSGAAGYADPATSFAVGWQSNAGTLATKIRVGTSEGKLDTELEGYSYLVPQEAHVGPEEGIRFHEAHVCGLTPGRTYWYQVGGGDHWSATYSTTTAPAAGSSDAVKIGIVGDTRDALGNSELPVWHALTTRFKADATPIVLFSGDMVLVTVNQNMWDAWSNAADDATPTTFFALAPGNHENEQLRFFAHAVMPGANSANAKRYASFDYGPVHVVMLDDYPGIVAPTIDDSGHKEELLAWLESDLSKADANRAKVPWIVTFHHHPMYSDTTNSSREKESANMRAALLSIYDKHGVDLDLCGHDHFYERFKPLAGGAESAKGTTYVIDGAGGAPSYDIKSDTPLAAKTSKYDPVAGQGIYGIATASGTSFKVTMRQMSSATAGSPDGDTIVDEFELTKR